MSRFDFDALDGVLDGDVEATGTQTVPIPKAPPERPVAPGPLPPQRAEVEPVRLAKPAPRRPWLLVGAAALVLGLTIGWTAGTRIPSQGGATKGPVPQTDHAEAVVAPDAAATATTANLPRPATPRPEAQPPAAPEAPPPPVAPPMAAVAATPTAPPTAPVVAKPPPAAPKAPQAAPATQRWTIPFGFDSAAVTRAADIAAASACTGHLDVVGHTDSTGARAYNDALSLRRAAAIGAQLEAAGVAHDRITLRGAGSSQPLVAGTTLPARKTNRRVEIHCAP